MFFLNKHNSMIEMISTLKINEDEVEIDFVVKEIHS